MIRIFLAYSFQDADKELVNYVEQILASHGLERPRNDRLGGEAITRAVQKLIDDSDALIALLTRRDKKANGSWTTHDWVKDELTYARSSRNKKAIALIENGVEVGGMNFDHEHVELDRARPHLALLALSDTIGQWNRAIGRTVKIQLMPPRVADKLGNGEGALECRHRLNLSGQVSEWQTVTPSPETGGTFVYVAGVQEGHLIQLQVRQQHKVWESVMTSQWMQVELKPKGAQR
jgi:hypothetical protein